MTTQTPRAWPEKSNFEWLSEAVETWNQLLNEIYAEMGSKAISDRTKEALKKILEETDPWTMGPKEITAWQRILKKEELQMARDWQDKLRRGATYVSELSDLVASDLIPDETRWEKIRWNIWRK